VADDPITRCEGSNDTQPHRDTGAVMCAMCGRWFAGDSVPSHGRMDILAMLEQVTRG
jgi:hypothetical protein